MSPTDRFTFVDRLQAKPSLGVGTGKSNDGSELDSTWEAHRGVPFIGPAEQALFSIEDTRERADALKAKLTSKLKLIFDEACDCVRTVYGSDALAMYSTSETPAHRPKAKKTQAFDIASVGLRIKGEPWFLQQRLECSSTHLSTRLFGLRGREANPLVVVLQRHTNEIIRLTQQIGCEFWSNTIATKQATENLSLYEFIKSFNQIPDPAWDGSGVDAYEQMLPIEFGTTLQNIYAFVALFPIFRTATDILQNLPDHFPGLVEMFWQWDRQFDKDRDDSARLEFAAIEPLSNPESDEEVSAVEGEIFHSIQRHRRRELHLRIAKMKQALREGHGRLTCEVPGCGFDFFEVYGDIGREFAIVHHKAPLADRTAPELTKLDDLAIVCANCHAMIHRGHDCRPLEGLLRSRRTNIVE